MKKERLTIEDRMLIEKLIKENYKLKDIARVINAHSSTISREIKNRRIGNKQKVKCVLTDRFPFVCYNCNKKYSCSNKIKYYYSYKEAEMQYQNKLKYSRIGIDMSIDEIDYWNTYFENRLKDLNQPITHIFNNIDGNFPKSIQTFYKYVHKGYFPSINDEMLARSFSYKPRKKTENIKTISVNNHIKINRNYDDYHNYIKENPNANVVYMDTVIGKFEDVNCILTLYFVESHLMLMFYIKKYKPAEVIKVFNRLKNILGVEQFRKMFEVILTDNGWEFSKPLELEIDPETGEKIINIFYCNPYSSWQKSGIERNHEFIRYIIQKGITFDNLNKKRHY